MPKEDGTLAKMLERVEKMEELIRSDAAGARPRARAEPEERELPARETGRGGPPSGTEELVAELEKMSQNVHEAFLRQLRRYREITPWPMPMGYRKRMAAPYLAQVYRAGGLAATYAQNWIMQRGLRKCSPAQEMLAIMQAVDDSILTGERDVINSVAFEKLVRRAYGLERAYEDVHREEDWRRPEGKKSWQSKVN